jgi:hypothetical protein
MTSTTDRNDLMPPQVFKLEWVTPKISLMVAEDTEGKINAAPSECGHDIPPLFRFGPS